jgi:hypothetical protein
MAKAADPAAPGGAASPSAKGRADAAPSVGTVTASGGLSPQAKTAISNLLAQLIKEGENPPTMIGSTMWDLRSLARWYGLCGALSSLLSNALGDSNVWKTMLTSWDSTKADDHNFHMMMLGTLDAIKFAIEGE